MSWIEKLYETYERCEGRPQFETKPLNPVATIFQTTHIEVRIDAAGTFLRATFLRDDSTVIPVTEASAGRSGKDPAPHPLSDKLCYCAKDFEEWTGEVCRFAAYFSLLSEWCSSSYSHAKARAVQQYVQKGTLIADLVRDGALLLEDESKNLRRTVPKKLGRAILDQRSAFIRWSVEIPGELDTNTWEDQKLFESWIAFEKTWRPSSKLNGKSKQRRDGICMATGAESVRLARMHPRGIRFQGDTTKLISSNDTAGYTFRGRFKTGDEACGVSFEVTQKAHNALRWLIARQSKTGKRDQQVFITWPTSGHTLPDLLGNSDQIFNDYSRNIANDQSYSGDAGQRFSIQLKRLIEGYKAELGENERVMVMGLNSASDDGRMAITFYRELLGSEFLARIQAWHDNFAWHQEFREEDEGERVKSHRFVGAPAPREIAETAYGVQKRSRSGEKLVRATIERLLPCIVDGRSIPRDLVQSCVFRASNRLCFTNRKPGKEESEWKQCLGIACAVYRGLHKEKNYQMSLEENRRSRDYLFGRLLAIADHLEGSALDVAGENRDTNAAKLMQRFADRPTSTWRSIETKLVPYRSRLRARRPGTLVKLDKQLNAVMCKFDTADFNDDKLSGEFLLGYHCQRAELWKTDKGATENETDTLVTEEGEE